MSSAESSLPDAALQRGIAHHQAGRMTEAEQSYRGILQTEPNRPDANHNLGILMMQEGKVALSLPHLRAALEANPEKGQYWLSYAENLLATGEVAGALVVLQQAKKCGLLSSVVDPFMSRAKEALPSVVSNADSATFHISFDERVFKIKPDFAEAHNAFGNGLVLMGKLDAALISYGRALALRPDMAEAHNNLSRTLLKQGRLKEAEAACRRAIAIAPNYAEAHATLGKILWNSNQEVFRIKETFQALTRSAELSYRASVCNTPNHEPILPHKSRHDEEQRNYLSSIGICDNGTGDIFHLASANGGQLAQSALNLGGTSGEVSEQWQRSSPKIVVIDDFLTNEALDNLRRFCWRSTVWRKAYKNGYLGARPKFGFACPLLAQIADELPRTYPTVFASHPLTGLWAFKYDSQLPGTEIHADFAAINVNFWITPDDANLDPKSGGLVIWDKVAPPDWDFAKYNSTDTIAARREFLAHCRARSLTIPYRSNRAVIFDSDLFHETDRIVFREGYLNRRINITLLYGRREMDHQDG
jgi:tetratricopeptide (TPR) repeat protein